MQTIKFFLAVVMILAGVGCATHLPGNSEHSWLNGRWFADRGSGWTTELSLEVVDGNAIIGTNTQTAPDGRRGTGDVRGRVDGEKVNFEVYFPHSGNTYKYALQRNGNTLQGRSDTGGVILKKVSGN